MHLAEQEHKEHKAEFVCPGMKVTELRERQADGSSGAGQAVSRLSHWPVQLKLVPVDAPYFANADLLLAADCVAFAMGDFHARFLKGCSVVVGCPKLDDAQFYVEKLAAIVRANRLKSLRVVHMEVPCCFGLTRIAEQAILASGVDLAFEDVTVDLKGGISNIKTVRPTEAKVK